MKLKKGLKQRLQNISKTEGFDEKIYFDRLDFEVGVINQMGYGEGYFLIVADFINWSKQNNIPVGPGRGSGAGSVVAYSLGITDLDPIEYNLLLSGF